MTTGKVIGIDLGTTYSCVAVMEGGKPQVIVNSEGSRTTPSVVGFTRSGERIVGHLAKRQAVTNPARTSLSIKREMGSNYRFNVDGNENSPEQISAMILQKLKADAEAYIGETIEEAVITVPAYFNDLQRQATRDAGQIAGLKVLRIINEPTASALAYGLDKASENATILVYDLGGGTFDVSILEITDGVFEVKATSGNNRLGGDDFDQSVIDWMKEEFRKTHGIDLSNDLMAIQRLKETAEKAKIELSSSMVTEIHLPFLTADSSGPKHFQASLTRAKFNELTAHLVESTMEPVQKAIEDSGLDPDEIDHVILVGGSTRIPAVQDVIKRFFQKEPVKSINPDEAVALGAAIQASILTGETQELLLLDVTPLSLGIETAGGLFTKIIERNTTVPTSRSMTFTTTEDGQTSVEVHCLQGERELAKYNKSLARFSLDGIPRAPRGMPKIEVSFDLDADGIVHVGARDAASGMKQSMVIRRSSGLSRTDVERMEQEASEFAEQDRIQKEEIALSIRAESLASEAERTIKKYKGVVEDSYLDKVQQNLDNLKAVLPAEGQSTEEPPAELKALVDKLDSSLLEVGRIIYSRGRDLTGEKKNNPPEESSSVQN
ncbi:MAG: molecular chaperone DnaK [Candidatus Obscuribacterales bacterium]|nr:molecular chaperone DnaK [Candidatus Obscuribacterales bacterium]